MTIKRQDLIDLLIETRPLLTDQRALKYKAMYPLWKEKITITQEMIDKGLNRYQSGDKLYKCKRPHTTQAGWEPSIDTASLWEVIDVEHAGTQDDPIPYDPNMAVYENLYYTYDGVLYRCKRDSGNPLYTTPDTLVNNYFDVV